MRATRLHLSKYLYYLTAVLLFILLVLTIKQAVAATVVISPANTQGWGFFEETPTGSGAFVTGPSTPPQGLGSVQLTVDGTGGQLFGVQAYTSTLLSNINTLTYQTYRQSGSAALAPSFQMLVDYDLTDGNTGWQGRLVYEPSLSGTNPSTGVWESWDTLDVNARWWATQPPGNATCSQGTPCTWATILSTFPNAGIHSTFPMVGFKAGGGWASSFVGNVDDFTIEVSGVTTNYDFEFSAPVHNVTQDTYHTTIQEGVDNATAGDVLAVDPGTYAENVVIDKSLTLGGSGAGTNPVSHTILDGSSLGSTTSGIQILGSVTNITIEDLTVQDYVLSSSNHAGIAGAGSNNNVTVQRVHLLNNTGGRGGLYLNGPVDTVLIDNVTAHDNQGRGIVIWNGLKTNIIITNNDVRRNDCCGIELQDGTASGVTMSNNMVVDNADSGMSAIGLTSGSGANVMAGNTVADNGRYGIEIKNPNGTGATSGDGSIVIEGNTVELTATVSMNIRDHAGIAVFRRSFQAGNPTGYVDVPTGVVVRNNTVTGYQQLNPAATTSEGFGIAVEGTNHSVTGNTVQNNEIGIQEQGGLHPNANYVYNDVGDGNQSDGASALYFGRGNAPLACTNTISGSTFGGNGTDIRQQTVGATGLVINSNTTESFCTIQAAIDDVDTVNGHTLQLTSDTYNESGINIDKSVIINGNGMGLTIIDAGGATGFTVSTGGVAATLQNMTIQNSSTAVSVSNGSLTVRGNALDSNTAVFASTGGTLTAYANNITTFTNAGLTAATGTINGRHNWWGTYASQPTGVDNDSWAFLLGAAVSTWVDGTTTVTLADGIATDDASLSGNGRLVIVNHGSGLGNVPFGKGIPADTGGSQCADFYDFFAIGGSGNYNVSIPVDGTNCDSGTISDQLFEFALNGSGQPDLTCSPDSACWNTVAATRVGDVLTANVPAADLLGTPFAAPSVNNNDPTAVSLMTISAISTSSWLLIAVLFLFLTLISLNALSHHKLSTE